MNTNPVVVNGEPVEEGIARMAATVTRATYLRAVKTLWKYLIMTVIVFLAMITVMWGNNVAGFKFLIPALFFAGLGISIYLYRNGYRSEVLSTGIFFACTAVVTSIFAGLGVNAQYLNILPAGLGLLIITMVGLKTEVLLGFSALGLVGSFFTDKRELERILDAVANDRVDPNFLAQFITNRVDGVRNGLYLNVRLVVTTLMIYGTASFILTAFTFKDMPGAFWIMLFGALMGFINFQYDKSLASKTWKIVTYPVIGVCAILALMVIFDTLQMYYGAGEERVREPYRPYQAQSSNSTHFSTRPAISRSLSPAGSPTEVVVPRCGSGFAKVNIPSGWNITMGWNERKADYYWRDVISGKWVRHAPNGADAVRMCAKYKSYAGDSMHLSWSTRA